MCRFNNSCTLTCTSIKPGLCNLEHKQSEHSQTPQQDVFSIHSWTCGPIHPLPQNTLVERTSHLPLLASILEVHMMLPFTNNPQNKPICLGDALCSAVSSSIELYKWYSNKAIRPALLSVQQSNGFKDLKRDCRFILLMRSRNHTYCRNTNHKRTADCSSWLDNCRAH